MMLVSQLNNYIRKENHKSLVCLTRQRIYSYFHLWLARELSVVVVVVVVDL